MSSYFNSSGIPVVQGSYVSSSKSGKQSLMSSGNESMIASAITRRQQQEADEKMSYYEASNALEINNGDTYKRSKIDLDGSEKSIPRGELQPKAFRDIFWSILFYAHLVGIGIATVKYSPAVLSDVAGQYGGGRFLISDGWFSWENEDSMERTLAEGENEDLEMKTIWTILVVSGMGGFFVSTLAMTLMMAIPTAMIKIALAFNLLVTVGVCIGAIMVGAIGVGVVAGIGVVFTIYYTYVVWKRIPFAASTLVTALTAVKCNMGLAFFAYNNLLITFLWSVWWSIAFMATFYVLGDCNAEFYCENEINGFLVFLFLVSFYWTTQVIKNVVHVTVAGTVGTWWFVPGEARSCCSSAVVNSYWRSVTTSFGSICFGSLLVALIQATREIVYSMRTQENSLILCIIDCILGILEALAEYFNKWAYIYVGLYGYGFIEASTSVLEVS